MARIALYGYLVMLLIIFFCVVQCKTSLKFRVRQNVRLPAKVVDKSFATSELTTCLMMCKLDADFECEAASWSHGMCLLSKTVAIQDQYNTLEKNEAWTTILRVVYPVFLARGDFGGYTLTFEAAEVECEELGSRVATVQDMLDAWTMGYEQCTCGWLSNGTKGYVMQTNRIGCGMNSDGLITHWCMDQALVDVYCVA